MSPGSLRIGLCAALKWSEPPPNPTEIPSPAGNSYFPLTCCLHGPDVLAQLHLLKESKGPRSQRHGERGPCGVESPETNVFGGGFSRQARPGKQMKLWGGKAPAGNSSKGLSSACFISSPGSSDLNSSKHNSC